MVAKMTKTKRFNGKVYTLLGNPKTTKTAAEFTVTSWRSRGRNRGARMVKVDGGYAVYAR